MIIILPFLLFLTVVDSLQTICNFPHYNRIVSEIRNIFLTGSVKFCWTLAYVGTTGNERVDAEAKKNIFDFVNFLVGTSLFRCRKALIRAAVSCWQTRWESGDMG